MRICASSSTGSRRPNLSARLVFAAKKNPSEKSLRAFQHAAIRHDARVALPARKIADLDDAYLPYRITLVGHCPVRRESHAALLIEIGGARRRRFDRDESNRCVEPSCTPLIGKREAPIGRYPDPDIRSGRADMSDQLAAPVPPRQLRQ